MDEKKLIEIITETIMRELNYAKPISYKLDSNTLKNAKNVKPEYLDPSEVVIGVGPAFMSTLNKTINDLKHKQILSELMAGIEEEGLNCRVFKVCKTSDVAFIGKEAANISGSGVGIGLQSKGTAVIHHRSLDPLSNLELFPQAPLLTLDHYRQIGRNAAKYVKSEAVKPVAVANDPMIRSSYQVKAALMHITETECVDKSAESFEFVISK